MTQNSELLKCPFCGSMLDQHDSDTLHRSGIVWRDVMVGDDLIRQYKFRSPALPWEPQGETWELHCNVIYGGCSAQLSGDSREEVIAKWQRRV